MRGLPTEAALRLHRQVAERAIKVAAVPGLDKPKARGSAVSPHHPRQPVRRRKLGLAELATLRTLEVFHPSAANGHPINIEPSESKFKRRLLAQGANFLL